MTGEMPPGFPTLPGDPAAIRACARAVGDLTGELEDTSYRVADGIGLATDSWTGPRAVAFRFAGAGVRGQVDRAATTTGDLASVLTRLATSLDEAQQQLVELGSRAARARAEGDAAEHRRSLLPAGDPQADLAATHARQEEQHCRGLATTVCEEHQRVAARLGGEIDALAERAVDLTGDGDLAALAALARRRVSAPATVAAAWRVLAGWVEPPCSAAVSVPGSLVATSPAAVATWWRGLTPLQQVQVVRQEPGRLGNLAGLPGWARDLANRLRLAGVRQELLGQLAHRRATLLHEQQHPSNAGAHGIPARPQDDQRWTHLRDKLHAVAALTAVLALPGRRLLGLDARGGQQLHAAVAVGDVDTARNVAVFTPGLTSTVQGSLRDYDRDMDHLRRRADAFDNGDTATVTWLGYDAPQTGQIPEGTRSVLLPHLAKRGSTDLAGFLTGIDVNRTDGVHLVALGHSYGSTTTGYALAHGHTGADDVALFGSPGYGVWHWGGLHVPAGHLYDVTAALDPVAAAQMFGGLPATDRHFVKLAPNAVDGHRGITGHTHYLDDGTTSQWDLAAVVAGRPDRAYRSKFTIDGLGRIRAQ